MCTEGPVARYSDPSRWHEPGSSEPNDSEILFFALLLADSHSRRAQQLQCWAQAVLDLEGARAELGAGWKPLDSWGRVNNMNTIWQPLHEAYVQAAWPAALLDKIGLAMQGWAGSGQCDGLNNDTLGKHRSRKLCGIKDAKGKKQPRWQTFSVFAVSRGSSSAAAQI